MADNTLLTPRWYPLTPYPKQVAFAKSNARFICTVAGRRSGKTEILKRRCVKKGLQTKVKGWWGVLAAPTRDQAKRIFWNDLKLLVPRWALAKRPMEAELTIQLINGAEISVVGMDKPDRIEGRPLDFFGGDEFGNMKESTWKENIRPALSTLNRPGEAVFTGVPESRNHFYRMFLHAQEVHQRRLAGDPKAQWEAYHWPSEDVLNATEEGRADLAEAKATLDPQTYDREYNANFVNFEGRVYYAFKREDHAKTRCIYRPELPIIITLDFNISPGVAVIIQEQDGYTCAIGEVWIPQDSNTELVAKKLCYDWAHHKGEVRLYGDATGGAPKTQSVDGSDWDILYKVMRPIFGSRLRNYVPRANPYERIRVNAVNARLRTADGEIHARFDPVACAHLIEDLDSVTMIEGGSGEIDKKMDPMLTHISDAYGYYIAAKFPIQSGTSSETNIY